MRNSPVVKKMRERERERGRGRLGLRERGVGHRKHMLLPLSPVMHTCKLQLPTHPPTIAHEKYDYNCTLWMSSLWHCLSTKQLQSHSVSQADKNWWCGLIQNLCNAVVTKTSSLTTPTCKLVIHEGHASHLSLHLSLTSSRWRPIQ